MVLLLGLDINQSPASQYRGKIGDLEDLATELKANRVRFVVVDYPAYSSYAIPRNCAHMFVTLRLVE